MITLIYYNGLKWKKLKVETNRKNQKGNKYYKKIKNP